MRFEFNSLRRRTIAVAMIAALSSVTHSEGLWNFPFRTMGGKQVWADIAWHAGWRVQEHALTGHHRLLDPGDVRWAWGSEAACRSVFERRARHTDIEREHLVVLLHGLGRSQSSFARMESALRADGYAVAAISYPSTRRSVAEHADRVEELLDGIEGPRRVSFVTHSLGGLLAREVLARDSDWKQRLEVGRLVMIAPPSQGSALAARAVRWPLVRGVMGPSLRDATPTGAEGIPLPSHPFGIVVGARGKEQGWCPWISGDDDGVVGTREARLPGAIGLLVLDELHTFLPGDAHAIAGVRAFLKTGRFPIATSYGR
jgi:pimeloyl-ACP methyl ester carboxylesterase